MLNLALAFLLAPAIASTTLNLRQGTMLQTLQQVVSIFAEEYAPFDFKTTSEKFDLAAEIKKATETISSNPDISNAAFQDLLVDLVNATRDFHVSISFYSTEEATLPFQILSSRGRYFVVYIDRDVMPAGSTDFDVGTEVLEFDGKPIKAAVRALIPTRIENPSPAEWRNAESQLTRRSRRTGMKVPSGEIVLKVKSNEQTVEVPFTWQYTPEYIPEIPVRNMVLNPQGGVPRLAIPIAGAKASPYDMASSSSYVPELGTVLGNRPGNFNAYLFRTPKGSVAGYVRINTFSVDKKEPELLEEFGAIMNSFEPRTDALILDLTHNPGGSISYMYGLLARLAKQPLKTLPQQMMISTPLADDSAKRVAASFVINAEYARSYLTQMGFTAPFTSFDVWQSLVNNDRFILSELKAGRRLTRPTYMYGISRIPPHPTQRYTKPIIVLIDESDFSAADFMPAILQDNRRAISFGARTAGAGGSVRSTQFPNQFGIDALNYTWTIAQRLDGSYLENNGVTPDIPYEPSPNDFKNGFVEYREALMAVIEAEIAKVR